MSLVPYLHLDVALPPCRAGDLVPVSREESHHLAKVLRLRPGADVEVADGAGWWAPAEVTAEGVRLVGDPIGFPAARPALIVAQGLPKGRKLDEVVRQVTELGVDAVVPVSASRSVPRLVGDKAEQAVTRWRAVGRAAAEQARRPYRPEVPPVVTTATLAAGTASDALVLVAHPGGVPLPRLLDTAADASSVTVAVGPEGGWSPAETDMLTAAGCLLVGLGPTVLRTEHAAAAAVAVLAAGLGRW